MELQKTVKGMVGGNHMMRTRRNPVVAFVVLSIAAQLGCGLQEADSEFARSSEALGTGVNLAIKKIAVLDYSYDPQGHPYTNPDARSAWVQVTYENKGTVATPATTMAWYVSSDRRIDPAVDTLVKTTNIPALAVGQKAIVERILAGAEYPYAYVNEKQYVGVIIDPANAIVEDKETDNVKAFKAKAGDAYKLRDALRGNPWRIDFADTVPCPNKTYQDLCQDLTINDWFNKDGSFSWHSSYALSWHRRVRAYGNCEEPFWGDIVHFSGANTYNDNKLVCKPGTQCSPTSSLQWDTIPPYYENDLFNNIFMAGSNGANRSLFPAHFFFQNVKTEMHIFNEQGDWILTATKGLCPTGT